MRNQRDAVITVHLHQSSHNSPRLFLSRLIRKRFVTKNVKNSSIPSLPPSPHIIMLVRNQRIETDFNLMHKISNISYRSNFSVIVMFSLDPYPLIISFVVNRRFARKALSFAIAIATLFENCSKTIARKITVEVAKH